jgi:hypothetical protein
MIRPLYSSPFALLTATLGLLCACSARRAPPSNACVECTPSGTETDNPVVGSSNPVIDGPSNGVPGPVTAPPCNPPFPSNGPNFPSGLASTLLLPAPNPHVVATGRNTGLDFVDVSDPSHPMKLSGGLVRGTIQQLLLSASGKLWVAATEPPSFPDSGLPDQPALDAAVHIVELDVTDPHAPLLVAEAQVDGTFWQMQERGDSIWALTARRAAAERDCSYLPRYCGGSSYEAVVLRGFRVDASELTPIAEAELPFDTRAFWRPDGVVTSLSDGSLHLLTWDAQGSLRAPLELTLGDATHRSGPVDVVGNQFSVVDTPGDRTTLRIYDLAAGLDAPQRSADLGPRAGALSAFSLFDAGKLWLSNGYAEDFAEHLDYSADAAQLWDVSGDTPQRIDLTQVFPYLVPITGATLDTDPTALLAVGWQDDPYNTPSVVALSGGTVSVLAQPPGALSLQMSAGASTDAPLGVNGSGSSDSWQLVVRGAGLPLGIDPPYPLLPARNSPLAIVEVPLSGAAQASQTAEARLLATSAAPTLQITAGSSTVSFDVDPNATKLVAISNGVIVVADGPTGDAPGIAVYDLTGQPRLAGSAAFPSLPGRIADPTWSLVRGLGESSGTPPLGDGSLTLVADLDLLCRDEQTCAAIGIDVTADPTVATPEPCGGPNADACESQREYVYALSLDATLSPSWQPLGISTLESTSARPDQASRFGSTIVAGNVAGATRLERLSSSGEVLPDGQARFMFDRFPRSPSGNGITYPAVNVIGQPVARLADSGSAQLWLSVDAALGAASADNNGAVHLLYIDEQGAHDAQSLPLPGTFAGAVTLQRDDGARIPIMLTIPDNSCGTSQLTALGLDASGTLQSLSTLELPEDRWGIVATDGDRVVLRRGDVFALVEFAGNALRVHSLRSSDGYSLGLQLLGTRLFGIGGTGISGANAFLIDF